MIKPLVSEKSIARAKNNQFCFIVDRSFSKPAIAHTIADIFKVDVKGVKVFNRRGKVKRIKGRLGKRSDSKIAIVKVAAQQTISGFYFEEASKDKKANKNEKT